MSICVINASGTFFKYEGSTYIPTEYELHRFNITDRVVERYVPEGSNLREDILRIEYLTLSEGLLRDRSYIDTDLIFVYKDAEIASIIKDYIVGRYGCSVGYVTNEGVVCEL